MHTPVNITELNAKHKTYTCNRIYRYIITGNDRTGGLTQESRTLPAVDLESRSFFYDLVNVKLYTPKAPGHVDLDLDLVLSF